jgi:hypothetical protein
LLLLVAVSVGARFVASLGFDAPWIAPDEMIYGILGRSFWKTGHMQLLAGNAPFYGFYPLVAGLPLAAFGTTGGLVALKLLQAVLMTSASVVAYVWTRPLVGSRWALAAAAMTISLPALAYSGMIMSEAAFFPAATLTLWLLSLALVEPSRRNQGLVIVGLLVTVAMRFQGVVLLPAIAASIFLMAGFSRDKRLVRRFVPTFGLLGLIGIAWLLIAVAKSSGTGFGAYGVVGGRGYSFIPVLSWTWRHVGDVFLLVAGAPLVAALILAVETARGREREPAARALVAVTFSYGVFLIVEVGVFTSRFVGQLAERNLITIAPPLFVAFAVWLGRGMPRPPRSTAIAALLALAVAAFWPVERLVSPFTAPDSFTVIPLLELTQRTNAHTLQTAWICAAAGVVALTLLMPRRAAPALAVLVIAALGLTSVMAQGKIDSLARFDRTEFFGASSPQWIDHATGGPVAYLDDDGFWNASWHLAFWNEKLKVVATMPNVSGSRPDGVAVVPQGDGRLVDGAGLPLNQRLVLARTTATLVGKRIKKVGQGPDEPGIALWQTPSTPTLSTWIQGLQHRGDILAPVTVTVYKCVSGGLEVELETKGGLPAVDISVDGLKSLAVAMPSNSLVRGVIPAPPAGAPQRQCVFTIAPNGPMVLRGITFDRGPTPSSPGGRAVAGTVWIGKKTVSLRPPAQLAYCVGGSFQMLAAGMSKGAPLAHVVAGKGLTCDPPPAGYVRKGLAPPEYSVPENTYTLYGEP